jgi:hypothetical protein
MAEAQKRRVILGGCIVSGYDPAFACERCGRYFDRDGSAYTGEVDPKSFRRAPRG